MVRSFAYQHFYFLVANFNQSVIILSTGDFLAALLTGNIVASVETITTIPKEIKTFTIL